MPQDLEREGGSGKKERKKEEGSKKDEGGREGGRKRGRKKGRRRRKEGGREERGFHLFLSYLASLQTVLPVRTGPPSTLKITHLLSTPSAQPRARVL